MSELPENTVEVWFDGGTPVHLSTDEVWLKVGTVTGTDGVVCLADLVALLNPPKPAKGPRLFPGHPPTWPCLGQIDFVEVDGVRWSVSVRDDYRKKPIWRDVKVYADAPVPDKANYSLSWNTRLGVFADGDAFKLLKAYRPSVLAAVSAGLLKVNWP